MLDRNSSSIGLRSDVSKSWATVKNVPPEDIDWDEDPLSVHLLKLATVKSYLDGRKELLGTKATTVAVAGRMS